ncbi:MAG: DUF3955 domain-containing protein [Enterococcus sp.]
MKKIMYSLASVSIGLLLYTFYQFSSVVVDVDGTIHEHLYLLTASLFLIIIGGVLFFMELLQGFIKQKKQLELE